jgi:hypothetical protein
VTETYTAEAFKAMLAQSNAAKDSQSNLKAETGVPPAFPSAPQPPSYPQAPAAQYQRRPRSPRHLIQSR